MSADAYPYMPMLSIEYTERGDKAAITPGDLFGVWHFSETRPLAFDKLPTMYFQLADRGYLLDSVRRSDGSVLTVAYSPEYKRRKGWGD